MKEEDHRLILEQAARATIERIRRDGEKAPERLKIVFAYLKKNLFERGLDVNQMKRACGKRDNSVTSFFADVTGLTAYSYIVACRIDTAAALLRETNLQIRIISSLVGFTKLGILIKHFKARHGITPREFRSDANRRTTSNSPHVSADSRIAHGKITFSLPKESLERVKMEGIWDAIKVTPWARQRDMIRHHLAFPTPALFYFFHNKSISEGRSNRPLGVHLSELAIESLRVTEQVIGRDLFDLRVQGWAWTGNARRLAYDLCGAEEAFTIAERQLPADEGSLICAEYYQLRTALRRCQRRFSEAFELHRRALPIFLAEGDFRQITEALLERAFIYDQFGEPEGSIPYLKRALEVVEKEEESYLKFVVTFNLAAAYAKANRFQEAAQVLAQVRGIATVSDFQGIRYHLDWLEGIIENGLGNIDSAEARFLAARNGFPTIGYTVHWVLVTLDLSLLYLKKQRNAEVREMVMEVIPVLKSMKFHDEAAVCLRLLQSAITKNALDLDVLREIRSRVDQIPLDIAAQFSVID